jgi:myosin heavy subunit
MALAGDKEAAAICLSKVGLEEEQYRLGHTKVFFRAGVLGLMEEKRDERIQYLVTLLQAQCRCYLIQKKHLLFKSQR